MEFFSSLLSTQSNLSVIFQIALDIIVLALLTVILAGRKQKLSKKDAALIETFEKIIEETGAISREFEENLEKRQELIQQITARLDQRIQESRDLCIRLERLEQTGAESARALSAVSPSVPKKHSEKTDQQKVLFLANKGLDAPQIAKSLKKPLGEVELILNLRRIAS